jgi:hypothetical protein
VPSFSFNTTWHFLALQIDSQLQGQAPQGPPGTGPPQGHLLFLGTIFAFRFLFPFALLGPTGLQRRLSTVSKYVKCWWVGGQIWKTMGSIWING